MSFAATAEGIFSRGFLRAAESYCKLVAGMSARMGLQALYFFVLANTLSLADMGLFASASATGLMFASFAGLGFGNFAFRAAAGKPRLLGNYLGLFYVGLAITTPVGLLAALPFWLLLFKGAMSLTAFLAIILVEILFWRAAEVLAIVQNGMGRFTAGALAITQAAAIRAGGAVAFALSGGGGIEIWATWYFAANALALSVALVVFYPPVQARWSLKLLRNRLRDGMMFALSYFALNAQGQIDKLIVLTLTDARFAGIYAISSRIVDFTALPFRSFYTLYTRKLFGEGKRIKNAVLRTMRVEGAILGLSVLGFGALVLALWWQPHLLGANVAVATQLFLLLLLVPAFRNLMEFHGELFFVYGDMTTRAAVAIGLVLLSMALLALLLSLTGDVLWIGLGLNVIYGLLYLLSGLALYRFVTGQEIGEDAMSDTLTKKMPPPQGKEAMPGLIARVRHKLATHLPVSPFNATSDSPTVSFTFDDVPVTAATAGAGLLEEAGVRGTYYVAGGLLGQKTDEWQVIGPDAVVDLHARGHEIGCHSHSHIRADLMSPAAIEADIALNHKCLRAIEPSLPLKNFAYPYGQTTYSWKRRLDTCFRSSRSIRPRINAGPTDAQFLHAVPLVDREIDEGGIDRAFESVAKSKGWLIFYSHDVDARPSLYGCTPRLMRHALKAAERFGVRVETIDAALTRIGARISTLWLMSLPLV